MPRLADPEPSWTTRVQRTPLDVLIVEDDADVGREVAELLQEEGHRIRLTADGREAVAFLERRVFDLVLSDIRLPGVDGLQLFHWLRDQAPATAVILMSAYGTVPEAVEAIRGSAAHYLHKPFELEHLLDAVREVAAQRALQQARSSTGSREPTDAQPMVGSCPAMRAVYDRITAIAASDAPVLIQGDSGTGKELVARAIHAQSERADCAFVAVNCAAFPETLFEAELFGYERGAFTGADRKRDGRFQAANGGTLFLDEVSEMGAAAQAKLLRVLEQSSFQRLGSNEEVCVDVRLLSATNADLRAMIEQGRFREDLYYRLKVLQVRLPPLRERRGDLPALVAHFLQEHTPEGQPIADVSPTAWAALRAHGYPGNVRELDHAIRHAVLLSRGAPIDVAHLPDEIRGPVRAVPTGPPEGHPSLPPLGDAMADFERNYLVRALAVARGNRTRTAAMLGISRKSLWQKMKRYGIDDHELESVPPLRSANVPR